MVTKPWYIKKTTAWYVKKVGVRKKTGVLSQFLFVPPPCDSLFIRPSNYAVLGSQDLMQSPINLATSLDPGADCVNQPEVGRARRRTYYGNSSLRRRARVRPRGACGRAQSQGRRRSRGHRQRGRGSRDLPSRSAAGFGQRDKYWSTRGCAR
jgi:hypothetical protein